MDLGISGKIAIVAAASKGFGREIALRLALEGANVVLCARNREPLVAAAKEIAEISGTEAIPVVADITVAEDCELFVQTALKRFGRVDVLVTNTGGPPSGSFECVNDEIWSTALQSTLMNVVRLVRLVVPSMRASRWGRIVNIASITAKQPLAGLALSNSLRPAILGLSKTLADELAPDGILVNTVCPGLHRTDRLMHLVERAENIEAELQKMTSTIPVGRLGRPQELADVVVFLCSERASFLTGTAISVDGGATRGIL